MIGTQRAIFARRLRDALFCCALFYVLPIFFWQQFARFSIAEVTLNTHPSRTFDSVLSLITPSNCASQLDGSAWYEYVSCSTAKLPSPSGVSAKPSITVLQPITQSKVYFNDWTAQPIMNAEVTPWALGTHRAGSWYSFLVSTGATYLCEFPNNIFNVSFEKSMADTNTCRLRQSAVINGSNAMNTDNIPLWRRDYYGAFSGHLLQTAPSSRTIYLINHGELDNDDPEMFPGKNGLVNCAPAPDIGYGSLSCVGVNWWGSYNAFVTMSSIPFTEAALSGNESLATDYGPITWPSNGYIESLDEGATWIKATDGGVRHPSSIIKDGFIYVLYEDLSQGQESDGRGPGIKIIRAPITQSGIDPRSFKMYFENDFTESALPPGYDLARYYTKWSAKGGRSSSLFPNNVVIAPPTPGTRRAQMRHLSDIFSFSVAKVNHTHWYLGVANESSKGVTIRLSKDLLHWSESTVVPGTESNYWAGGVDLQRLPLLYARLANSDGDSNTDIEAPDFYIIGTQTARRGDTVAKVVNLIHLQLNL